MLPKDFLLIRQLSQMLTVLIFCYILMRLSSTLITDNSLCLLWILTTGLLIYFMRAAISMKFVLVLNSLFSSFNFWFVWFPLLFERVLHSYFCRRGLWILKWNLLDLRLNSSIHDLTPVLTRRVSTFYERVRWHTYFSGIIWLANWLLLLDTHLFNLIFSSVGDCRFFSSLLHLNRLDYSCLKNVHVALCFYFLKFEVLNA